MSERTATAGDSTPWAIVLGASGVLGFACARTLVQQGHRLLGVHLDLSENLGRIEELKSECERRGLPAVFVNANAGNPATIGAALDALAEAGGKQACVGALVHALAFGSLARFVPAPDAADEPTITKPQLEMTMHIMAHSLVYWVQAIVARGLFRRHANVVGLTSIGGSHVLDHYGAVSCAKAALEAHVRQLAVELAPLEVSVNCLRAGVVDTPALRKIPGSEKLLERARTYNPFGSLTTPQAVADALGALVATPGAWVTGNVIGVDGGEKLTL